MKTNLFLLTIAGILASTQLLATDIKRVKARDFADQVNAELKNFSVRLHNHKKQESYLQWMGIKLPFNIDVIRIDIDAGWWSPDFGDGLFYVNDVTLKGQRFTYSGSSFHWVVEFEDKGREIKGYHNKFGDNWMPDFDMRNLTLSTTATPKLNQGKLGLNFAPVKLAADINSTGGCKLAGIDFCDKLFKTDRKIQKTVEKAATAIVNNGTAQNALSIGLMRVLQSMGITGAFTKVYLSGSDLVIEKP